MTVFFLTMLVVFFILGFFCGQEYTWHRAIQIVKETKVEHAERAGRKS